MFLFSFLIISGKNMVETDCHHALSERYFKARQSAVSNSSLFAIWRLENCFDIVSEDLLETMPPFHYQTKRHL